MAEEIPKEQVKLPPVDLVALARKAKGSELLPKVLLGTLDAETVLLRMADRIEELEEALEAKDKYISAMLMEGGYY